MISSLDYCGDLQDTETLTTALIQAGLSTKNAEAKVTLLAQAAEAVQHNRHTASPTIAYFVPGRIEVLGKHTDYAGGSSLLAAAKQGFCLVAAGRRDNQVHATDISSGQSVEFSLDADISPTVGNWSNYPMTVARRVARNFSQARTGVEVAFASDLPPAAGMSSSSALIVAFFLALADANRLWEAAELKTNVSGPVELASYLATIENGQSFGSLVGDRGVGTAGGSEDHTAILCCRPATLSRYAYCPARHVTDVAMPDGYTFVIATSGIVAEKTGAAMERYNRASHLARCVAEMWRSATGRDDPHLAAAIAVAGSDEIRRVVATAPLPVGDISRDALAARLEHFRRENEELLPEAVQALQAGDPARFGAAVEQSQRAAEELLGNQTPETALLASSARRLGAIAASAFGAGFGGSVWAMVERERAPRFAADWAKAYADEHPRQSANARFFETTAGPAALRIALEGEGAATA